MLRKLAVLLLLLGLPLMSGCAREEPAADTSATETETGIEADVAENVELENIEGEETAE